MNFKAQQIADIINGEIEGDCNSKVNSVGKIEEGYSGSVCFLSNQKYTKYIYTTKASVVIVSRSFKKETNKKISSTLIRVEDPYSAFNKLLEFYNKMTFNETGISKLAEISNHSIIGKDCFVGSFSTISKNSCVGRNVKIHSNCYIGDNVIIGDNTIIFSNVSIYHDTIIGSNIIIHSGSVIGSDGFGFAKEKKSSVFKKITQIGNVIIEDDVEIGANTTIDRATMGATKICNGVKLDNLIQIAHNVQIGENTVIAAQTAVAGSTKIGKNCMIGGQVAIAGHINIADNVKIAGKSGIASSINKSGSIVQGTLAFNIKEFQRSYIVFKKLPEMYKTLDLLKKKNNA